MRGNRMVGAKLQIWLISVCRTSVWLTSAWLISILLAAALGSAGLAGELSVTPASMARIGTVDERYQSYNIEVVEFPGGEFWKPYGPDRGVRAAPPPKAPGANNSNKN